MPDLTLMHSTLGFLLRWQLPHSLSSQTDGARNYNWALKETTGVCSLVFKFVSGGLFLDVKNQLD
jgi:hypothetical protein